MSRNRTTADLRETLFETLEGIKAGTVDPRQAKAIADVADRIIETADLELRYSEIVSRLDRDGQGISPGPLLLTDNKEKNDA